MRPARLRRLASADGAELRFRIAGLARYARERAGFALARPRWERGRLRNVLSSAAPAAALEALNQQRWHDAHVVLAEHFATRTSVFPLQARQLPELRAAISARFPAAAADAARRSARIAAGFYDILGYEGVRFGAPPDWHADPVNGRRAPLRFWAAVPYLDPACGDHKVIWEVNRHQHWLDLGRNRLLNGDRASYTTFVMQLEDWLGRNPPLTGINWASMLELAFRSLSWMWALHLFSPDARQDAPDDSSWTIDLLGALDRQLTHVERNLSRYFSPNTHLLGEALALYVAGHALPELSASARRIAIGREILLHEIDRQVHPDGGHTELSTHYHRYATDFYLLALSIARRASDPASSRFEDAARRMAHYLRGIASDAGTLPLIGDDDGGQLFPLAGRNPADVSSTLAVAAVALDDQRLATGPCTEEVLWLCGPTAAAVLDSRTRAPVPSAAFPESGYYVMRDARGDRLVLDAGRHGFLNGGHAHADALSVVLELRGTPLLVDPGAGVYTIDPELRDRFRSSVMHNTVVLDGKPHAEPNGPFHWRSRVDAQARLWRPAADHDYVEGTHAAYAPIRHTRCVLSVHGFGWLIVDHVLGDGRATADAFWHLDPEWSVWLEDGGSAALTHRSGLRTALASTPGSLGALVPGGASGLTLIAPVYGRLVETHVLTSRVTLDLPASFATFVAADPAVARGLTMRALLASAPDRQWHAFGIHISFAGGSATAVSTVERDAGTLSMPRPWGTEALRTDGRAAIAIHSDAGPPRTVVIDGTHVELAPRPRAARTAVLDRLPA